MANVTIYCDTEGAEIRYTVNQEGSPENGTLYEAPFSASEGDVIRAIGMKEGMENSQVAEVTIEQTGEEEMNHVEFPFTIGSNNIITYTGHTTTEVFQNYIMAAKRQQCSAYIKIDDTNNIGRFMGIALLTNGISFVNQTGDAAMVTMNMTTSMTTGWIVSVFGADGTSAGKGVLVLEYSDN